MRDRDRDVQIIEVLSPDDPSFWTEASAGPSTSDTAAPTPPSQPRVQRRNMIIAGLAAIVVVVGIGLSVAGDDSSVTAPSTTTVATTVRLRPVDPGDAASSGRFVIDDPDLRPYSADIVTPLPDDAMFQLWTSGDPAKPWLSVQAVHDVGESTAFTNSSRRVVDGLELVSPVDHPDTTDIVLSEDGWVVTIHGSGINDGDLTRLANGLDVNGRSTVDTDGALQALGLTLASTRLSATQLLYGTVTSEMRSLTADGTVITLRVADGWTENLFSTLRYFVTGLVEDADERISGTLITDGDAVVIWGAGDRVLSLTGAVASDRLLELSRTVRGVAEAEWKGLLYGLHPDFRIGEFETLATGVDADGPAWSAGLQLAERDRRTQYLWWWTSPDRPGTVTSIAADADLAGAPGVDTIVVRGATYVFVSVPAASSATHATVVAADGTSTELPLVQPFADVPVRAGAMRVDTLGAIEVVIDG